MAVRPAQAGDLDAWFGISLLTADAGADATALYANPRLMGLIYSAPYLLLTPEWCLSVEDAEGVCGFAVGAPDTRAFERRLEREWHPPLRAAFPPPDPARREAWSLDERRIAQIHAPRRTPDAVVTAFPAHMHLNLAPRAQGRGLGPVLMAAWLERAASRGVATVHVGVNAGNARGAAFWRRGGFVSIPGAPPPESGAGLWLGRASA